MKRGAKHSRPSSEVLPLSTSNFFSVLQEDDGTVDVDIVLVGDTLPRNQKLFFAKRHQNRKVFAYSGSSLSGHKPLESEIYKVTDGSNSKSAFIIEIGTNDFLNRKHRLTPQKLVNKYSSLLREPSFVREATATICALCILGLLPVLHEPLDDIWDRKLINELLSKLAKDENVRFISWWSHFT